MELPAPPSKRAKKSTADARAALKARRAGAPPPAPDLSSHVEEQGLVLRPAFNESLGEEYSGADAIDDKKFYSDLQSVQRANAQARQEEDAMLRKAQEPPEQSAPCLVSAEDIVSDLTVQEGVRLATSHASLRWLRRLPTALRCQSLRGDLCLSEGPVRDAALGLCESSIPQLLSEPDKAVSWLARVSSCLSWYEAEGPPRPLTSRPPGSNLSPSEREAQRRVEEWDEAYRSLGNLLRQGMLPCFSVVAERFSLNVFGEGAGRWTSSLTGQRLSPSQAEPCAVLWPSSYELRTFLQENHVHFVMASADTLMRGRRAEPSSTKEGALVPVSSDGPAIAEVDVRADIRELRRDGENALAPEDLADHNQPSCTALWFQGSHRVHSLLDLLRQYFVCEQLLLACPKPYSRLPLLLAPAVFANATVKSAEVVKTWNVPAAAGTTTEGSAAKTQSMAELHGRFFPLQLKRFLELLRVLCPAFSCDLTTPQRHAGANAFTQLGLRRIVGVSCESTGASPGTPAGWKWDFRLETCAS
eukprot:TRINITY_DN80601_c0_g1_i1.p1 TRINITY_DN80601_c0_g1~~TRINITY_DN80601_c0_g1_i1.p1  ORF type:complete len:529 (+),score=115.01 TRINITY_DN80601_c0_g1_i1:53-1639(+)